MPDTLRERIMEALVVKLRTMQEGEPADDPYTTTFSVVEEAPLDDDAWKKAAACGVYDTEEVPVEWMHDVVDAAITVVVEFRVFVSTGDVAAKELRRVLGDVRRRVMEDTTLGGLAMDIRELRNESYIDEQDRRRTSGAVILAIEYRHQAGDPRQAR